MCLTALGTTVVANKALVADPTNTTIANVTNELDC